MKSSHRRAIVTAALVALFAAPATGAITWREALQKRGEWLGSAEAKSIADSVVLYQTDSGGWPKNRDMVTPPDAAFLAETKFDHRAPTIDNGATCTQILFLSRVFAAQGGDTYRASMERGLDYLLAAQYPNGGWPQYFPVIKGYYAHITFNDDAMINVLGILRDIAQGKSQYSWVDQARRAKAATAVQKGVDCILRCQVVVKGQKTVWCAQHDEETFAPAPARKFEPVSLSGGESVGIVRFLMSIEHPSPDLTASIESAAAWFTANKLTGIRWSWVEDPKQPNGKDHVVVADPDAPPLWARFYEIGTNRPIFTGRDAVVHYNLAEIEHERRTGYAWYIETPRRLLDQDYPEWAAKWLKPVP
ncbi:MAG TPA: pectate lyase [Candidatus Didemnitutus sp.]|nr:pectate lyase [Candidatus Didemnitutus sp.]